MCSRHSGKASYPRSRRSARKEYHIVGRQSVGGAPPPEIAYPWNWAVVMMPPTNTEEIEMTVAVPFWSYRPIPLATLAALLLVGVVRAQIASGGVANKKHLLVAAIALEALLVLT